MVPPVRTFLPSARGWAPVAYVQTGGPATAVREQSAGNRREVSRQLQFIELDANGNAHSAGYAPFLNYRPLTEEEQTYIPALRNTGWLKEDLESEALSYAITELVPRHLSEVKQRREEQINKTMAAV